MIARSAIRDMRTPIAHALAFPERVDSGVAPLDLFSIGKLEFEEPDFERFMSWPGVSSTAQQAVPRLR